MNQPVAAPQINRSVVRTVIVVLCVIALAVIGIAILAGHAFTGSPHSKDWIGAGFLITAVAFAALLL